MLDNLSDKTFKERLPSLQNNFQMFPKLVAQVVGQCCRLKKVFARSKTFHIIRVHLQSSLLFDLKIPQDNSSHIFIEFQFKINFDLKT